MFENLAAQFERGAEKDDQRAAEWRLLTDHHRKVAEEHPEDLELQARVNEIREIVGFWEAQAVRGRKHATRFRRLAEGHWQRYRAGT